MRQVFIHVPYDQKSATDDILKQYDSVNQVQIRTDTEDASRVLFITNVSNAQIEGLFDDLTDIPETEITLIPTGVFAFQLDTPEILDQVTDVELLSPIEVFLSGLQSIGSLKGFLGYAAAAGILVWLGLIVNSVVLLIAGMLVSPLAGPAMNLAVGISRGDSKLLQRSLLRYGLAIATAMLLSAILTALTGFDLITQQMDRMSQVSDMAILIPLVIGAGGAISLIQSGNSSLVSGTVSGLLIAASLAPPVSLIGIGSIIGEWDMVRTSIFIVLLQLVGINLGGTIVLRLNDLKSRNAHYDRGLPWLFPVGLGVTVLALVGLFAWQQVDSPELKRATISQQVANDVNRIIDDSPRVELIELQTRFTRTNIEDQNTLLIVVYVQPTPDAILRDAELATLLREQIEAKLADKDYDITPLIAMTVLHPPSDS